MSGEREAFIRRICETPEDDKHLRLVFADWLDENGFHKRAEMIRIYFAGYSRDTIGTAMRRAIDLRKSMTPADWDLPAFWAGEALPVGGFANRIGFSWGRESSNGIRSSGF